MQVVPPLTFKLPGSEYEYPIKDGYKSPFLGYSSDMVNLALTRDDPIAFVHFMRMAGCDRHAMTFDGLTMERYCDKRGAARCKSVLSQLESLGEAA